MHDGRAAIENDEARGQPVDQRAIVRHHDHGAREILERGFERFARRDVEVVGGLVEQQHIRFAQNEFCDRDAPEFAAAQRADRLENILACKQETPHERAHLLGRPRGLHAVHFPQDIVRAVDGFVVLIIETDACLVAGLHLARAIRQAAREMAQEGGLAATVRADDANAFAALDADRNVLVQRQRTVRHAQVFCLKHDLARAHGPAPAELHL